MTKKLLIVDDEPSILVGMKRYFRAQGFEVDAASEKEEAIRLLAEVSYSFVIVDLRLTEGQGADGLDVVAFSRGQQPKAPVLVLTAYASAAAEAEARRVGAAAFLAKPQPLHDLMMIVTGLLEADR